MTDYPSRRFAPGRRWQHGSRLVRYALVASLVLASGASAQNRESLPSEGGSSVVDLEPGEEVVFEAVLRSGEFLHAVADQTSVNIELELLEGETKLESINRVPRAWSSEELLALPERDVTYRLVMRSVGTRPGRATLRVVRRGPATSEDHLHFEAEQLMRSTRVRRGERGSKTVTEEWLERAARAAEMFGALGLHHSQATAHRRIATLSILLGRPLDAVEATERGIAVARSAGDRRAECRLRLTRAEAVYNRSVEEALEEERYIVEHFSPAEFPDCLLGAYRLLIYDLNPAGQHEEAIEIFRRALPLTDTLDTPWEKAGLWNNVGTAYLGIGDLSEALSAFKTAQEAFEANGDRRQSMLALDNLVTVLRALGELEGLADAQRQVVAMLEQQSEPGDLMTALSSLAETLRLLGQDDEARKTYRRALSAEPSQPAAVANAARSHAAALIDWNELGPAKPLLDRALEIDRGLGNLRGVLVTSIEVGRWHRGRGELEQARSVLVETADRAGDLRMFTVEYHARTELAELLWKQRDGAARDAVERSIELVERQRRNLSSDRLRSSQSSALRRIYDLAIEIELEGTGRGSSALDAEHLFFLAERARARSLRDFLEDARRHAETQIDAVLAEREQELLREIESLSRERWEQKIEAVSDGRSPGELRALERRIFAAENELEVIAADRLRQDPLRGAMLEWQPFDLRQVRSALAGRTLLSYHVMDERILMFVVDDEDLTLHVIPATDELERLADSFRGSVRGPSRFVGQFAVSAVGLYEALIRPAAEQIGSRALIVSPDAWLNEVPFGALLTRMPEQGERWNDLAFLVREREISYVPSAGVLRALRANSDRPQPDDVLLALADPTPEFGFASRVASAVPVASSYSVTRSLANAERLGRRRSDGAVGFGRLPFARSEVDSIAGLLSKRSPGTGPRVVSLVGEEATEAAVRTQRGQQARYLHFAVHGYLDPELLGQSALVLTPDAKHDGLLQLREILRLRFRADLVTLSACETAGGRNEAGEGVMSLARAFLFAGASALVASLWEVSDEASAALMTRFYEGVFDGANTASALRAAKLELIGDPATAHPFYWGPFVLAGSSQ